MFDELMKIIRGESQDAVINNPAVPNEQNEAVMQEAGTSIQQSLQNMDPDQLQSMLGAVQNGQTDHPAVQQVADNFSGGLMEKLGLNSGTAKALAISLIPVILSKIMSHSSNTNQQSPDNSSTGNSNSGGGFNMGGLLGSLLGGGGAANSGTGGGLGGMLGGLFGGR